MFQYSVDLYRESEVEFQNFKQLKNLKCNDSGANVDFWTFPVLSPENIDETFIINLIECIEPLYP